MTVALFAIPTPTTRPATLNVVGTGDVPGAWRRLQRDGKATSPITRFQVDRDGGFSVGLTVAASLVVGQHSVRLTTDSATGQVLATANYIVQAVAPPPPPPPPVTPIAVISNVVATPSPTGVSVAWDVAPASQGQVEYGPTTAYGSLSTRETSYQYAHHVQDFPLAAGTYHFRIRGSAPGQTSDTLSPDGTFTVAATAPPPPPPPPPDPGPTPVPPPVGTRPAGTVDFPDAPTTQSDQGPAIIAFIRAQTSQGHVAGLPPGIRRWDAHQALSGIPFKLWIDPGAELRRISTSAGNAMLQLYVCDDAWIDGALKIVGPMTVSDIRSPGYTRENEHLIEVSGGKRGLIRGVTGYGAGGDGIYWHRANDSDVNSQPEDWTFDRIQMSVIGRNAYSHIGGRRIKLLNSSGITCKLHAFDLEPNRADDWCEDLLIENFVGRDTDAGHTSAGRGHIIAIGAGYGQITARRVTIKGVVSDRPWLYVVGPTNGRHEGVTVTGWKADGQLVIPNDPHRAGQGPEIRRVNGWVQSGNTGISLPASGNVG